ncbi:tyrosine-type recombinase/integrase [Nocardia sp. GCM10030253]|uniref:tyrosine-type recombinase/integrase n=1 Tax=Nocardia sp. GCM10030253 TaxID=3273404 RepID=UPI0036284AFA
MAATETTPAALVPVEVAVNPVLTGFIAWLDGRAELATRTRETYIERTGNFLAWVVETGEHPDALDNPAGRDRAVGAYITAIVDERGAVPSTVNVSLAAVAALYTCLGMGEPVTARAAVEQIVPRTLGDAEQRSLLTAAAARGPRAFAMNVLGLDVGPRESEIAALDDTDLDLTDFPGSIDITDSNGHTRTVPLRPGTRAALVAWLAHRRQLLGTSSTTRALFITLRAPHRRLAVRTVDDIIRTVGDDAGLIIAPGTLRATTEQRWLRAGTPTPVVAAYLGQRTSDPERVRALLGVAPPNGVRAPLTETEQLTLFGRAD